MTALQEKYRNEIAGKLQEELKLRNIMEVPKLKKIVLNMGLKEAVTNSKIIESAFSEVFAISGQLPIKTIARKSIAAFKLREGMPLGCMVTLRKFRMYAFLERFIHIALPRVRDFRGLDPHGFDGNGNYNMSVKEQIIFPEVDVDKIINYHGMNLTLVTNCGDKKKAYLLLKKLGLPFKEYVEKGD